MPATPYALALLPGEKRGAAEALAAKARARWQAAAVEEASSALMASAAVLCSGFAPFAALAAAHAEERKDGAPSPSVVARVASSLDDISRLTHEKQGECRLDTLSRVGAVRAEESAALAALVVEREAAAAALAAWARREEEALFSSTEERRRALVAVFRAREDLLEVRGAAAAEQRGFDGE